MRLAKFARAFPWVLEDTGSFVTWLTARSRSGQIRTFDFSNLFGTEPVQETLNLFKKAILEMPYRIADDEDHSTWKRMLQVCQTPPSLRDLLGDYTPIIVSLTAICIRETLARADIGSKGTEIIGTDMFLAMGSSPVAPISNITLAYLEWQTFGQHRCETGIKRLIDDIAIDEKIIDEAYLRTAYPGYLTLNESTDGHFLDLSYRWNGSQHDYWLYTKPHPVIPLNYNSAHPRHILISTARNELSRMLARTNLTKVKKFVADYWALKYTLAMYPQSVLLKMVREICEGWSWKRSREISNDITRHVELWRGARTSTSARISAATGKHVSAAWKVRPPLKDMAHTSRYKPIEYKGINQFLRSFELLARSPNLSFPSLFSRIKTPEDGSSANGTIRNASGKTTRRRK